MTENLSLIDISLDDFTKAPSLGIDIYLKLNDSNTALPASTQNSRFVKLAHGVEDLDADRVNELKSRGVDRVYLNLENLDLYIDFERKLLRAAALSHTLDPRKKLKLMRTTLGHMLRRAFTSDPTVVPLTALQEALFDSLEMLHSLPTGSNLIECLDDLPDDQFNHASLCSILSLLIAKELNWVSPITLQKVAMVGLFHDLGMKNMPETVLFTHPSLLKNQMRNIYHTHPDLSAEALTHIRGLSADVLLAIQQHHERLDGSGFPKGLSMRKIQPLALLIAVADIFLEEYYFLEDRSKLRVEGILRGIAANKGQALPADAILALCRVFQVKLDYNTTQALLRGGLNIG